MVQEGLCGFRVGFRIYGRPEKCAFWHVGASATARKRQVKTMKMNVHMVAGRDEPMPPKCLSFTAMRKSAFELRVIGWWFRALGLRIRVYNLLSDVWK